jgi:hypothetical protein
VGSSGAAEVASGYTEEAAMGAAIRMGNSQASKMPEREPRISIVPKYTPPVKRKKVIFPEYRMGGEVPSCRPGPKKTKIKNLNADAYAAILNAKSG